MQGNAAALIAEMDDEPGMALATADLEKSANAVHIRACSATAARGATAH